MLVEEVKADGVANVVKKKLHELKTSISISRERGEESKKGEKLKKQ